jgi:uncharacterized protein YndB with AHSA1/START domain
MTTATREPELAKRTGYSRATLTLDGDRGIHIEREFHAPRKRVWRAMTKRKLIEKWWGRGHRLDVKELDFEPGGHWRFVEKTRESEDGFEGRFGDIQKPARIIQTFEWDGMPAQTAQQTLTLEKIDSEHTRVTCDVVCFSRAARDGLVRSGIEEGMNQSYAALDKVLEEME